MQLRKKWLKDINILTEKRLGVGGIFQKLLSLKQSYFKKVAVTSICYKYYPPCLSTCIHDFIFCKTRDARNPKTGTHMIVEKSTRLSHQGTLGWSCKCDMDSVINERFIIWKALEHMPNVWVHVINPFKLAMSFMFPARNDIQGVWTPLTISWVKWSSVLINEK